MTFSTADSGMFSSGEYDEASKTLTVTFRNSGGSYVIPGVSKELGDRFMSSAGKSQLWNSELKRLGPVKA